MSSFGKSTRSIANSQTRFYVDNLSNTIQWAVIYLRPDVRERILEHEIGHALFNHFAYPTRQIMDIGQDYLSPLHAMKLYAWNRNAEVTADRVGLICCKNFEAATKSFFKLSSGITTSVPSTFHLSVS